MSKARTEGRNFTRIAAHFRRLRLGDKDGDELSLANRLIREINEYVLAFPGTDKSQVLNALSWVNETVDDSM
jgi:hypothetical protein